MKQRVVPMNTIYGIQYFFSASIRGTKNSTATICTMIAIQKTVHFSCEWELVFVFDIVYSFFCCYPLSRTAQKATSDVNVLPGFPFEDSKLSKFFVTRITLVGVEFFWIPSVISLFSIEKFA